jgi:hypothetical protein
MDGQRLIATEVRPCRRTGYPSSGADVSRAAAEMGSAPTTAAEMRSPTTAAEMGSAAPTTDVSAAPTAAASATTTTGPARGHQIDRSGESHDRRQKDCTNSNSVVCHDHLLGSRLRLLPEKAKIALIKINYVCHRT